MDRARRTALATILASKERGMDLKKGIPMIGNLLETWNQIKDRRE